MNKRTFLKLLGIGAAIKATCQKVWAFPFLVDRKCETGDSDLNDNDAPNETPRKRRGTRWNFEGRWNPSKEAMVSHLVDDHGVTLNMEHLTKSELRIIHDNVHNGYGPLGDGEGKPAVKRSSKQSRRGWFWR